MLELDFVLNGRARRVQPATLEAQLRERFAGRVMRFHDDPAQIPTHDSASRLVVAAGGDGTINRVLNVLGEALQNFAVLPLGTSNDLATHMGISRDWKVACDLIDAESFRVIDLIRVNDWRMATCGGMGFAVDVAVQANAWKASRMRALFRLLGPLIYPCATVRQLAAGRKVIDAHLTIGETTEHIPLSIAMVSNQPRFGKRFSTSPEATNTDGLLHLGVFGPARGIFDMPRIATRIYLAQPNRCPEARQIQAKAFTLKTAAPVPFFGDGEVLGVADCFKVQAEAGALRIISPPKGG
jgi:diacylglycerol kinase family enzyme